MVNTLPAQQSNLSSSPEPTFLKLPSDQDSSGRTLGAEELAFLSEAIQSGTLTSTKGKFVKALEQQFAEMLGVKYAYACNSGSAAVHTAIAAIDPEPGDEIITTSITDMGALTPILYQGAIPRFVDVDPETWNVTSETIAACITPRTKAIIVTLRTLLRERDWFQLLAEFVLIQFASARRVRVTNTGVNKWELVFGSAAKALHETLELLLQPILR